MHEQAQEAMFTFPGSVSLNVGCAFEEFARYIEQGQRRLYLYGSILDPDEDERSTIGRSMIGEVMEMILYYNREDIGKPIEEREPIRLYINSPGGDLTEGFALISVIEASKTPVYTINFGQLSSMSFLIGITGAKRYSLKYTPFLLHDGSSFVGGSTGKVQDRVEFDTRYGEEVIKPHVLSHGKMTSEEYDSHRRDEFYMLPKDALAYVFTDEIVDDLDVIL